MLMCILLNEIHRNTLKDFWEIKSYQEYIRLILFCLERKRHTVYLWLLVLDKFECILSTVLFSHFDTYNNCHVFLFFRNFLYTLS